MSETAFRRVLALEGIHNFRDYGGYAVRGGGRLREGWLYRSAQHGGATGADLEEVARLNLAVVIDLRSDAERVAAPCLRPDGFAGRVLFVPDVATTVAPHIAAARGVRSPEDAVAHMVASYAGMPFRPGFQAAMVQYFMALAQSDGPTLIHCMAGKDRTGVAVALLHRALGVERDGWMADYLMTNAEGNVEARIAAGATHVRAGFGRDLDDETVRVLMTVRPEFIDSAFAGIEARCGGLEGYWALLGIDGATIAAIRHRLLV